jgi:phytoene dehydrogenase-like protein
VSPDSSFDVFVIGAGHNALVAAAYLARAGLRVAQCERRDIIGGAAVTEELAPGFRVSTASYALSMLRPDIYNDLALERHGLVAVPKDPQMFVPLPDGRSFFIWRDAERTKHEIAKIHAPDAEGYARWSAFWDEATPPLRALLDDPDPLDPAEHLPRDLYEKCVLGSAADLVGGFFGSPEVQGAFASQGIIGTLASVRDPGTAWILSYHACGGEIFGSDGTWGFARGGMGAVTKAIAAAGAEAGVKMFRGTAATEIVIEHGRAVGARLANGMVVRASYIVSGADPRTTFLDLVPEGALDAAFVEHVRNWRTHGCVLKVNLALKELPDFVARPGRGPQHHGTIEISPSIDYLDAAYRDAIDGPHSSRPFMEVFVQSVLDRSLVDGDGHVVSAFTQYVSPDTVDTETATNAVIDVLSSYAPNVRDNVIAVQALGPHELCGRFGLPGGDIFHGSLLPEQSFDKRFDYRSPLPGLYLCGSGARPGGCVMGAAGRNAAHAVIDDLGRR